MNLKVTIEIDGTLHTKEELIDEQSVFTDIAVLDALQDILIDAGYG